VEQLLGVTSAPFAEIHHRRPVLLQKGVPYWEAKETVLFLLILRVSDPVFNAVSR